MHKAHGLFVILVAVIAMLACQSKSKDTSGSQTEQETASKEGKKGSDCEELRGRMNSAFKSMEGQVAQAGSNAEQGKDFGSAFAKLTEDWVGACEKGLLSETDKACIRNAEDGRAVLTQCLPAAMQVIQKYKTGQARQFTEKVHEGAKAYYQEKKTEAEPAGGEAPKAAGDTAASN